MPFSFVSSRICMTPPSLVLVYLVSVSVNVANTLLAEVGIGFGIAVIVIILALTINKISDKLSKRKQRHSPPGGGGRNVRESKAQAGNGTENPPLGTVKETGGFSRAKPWPIGEVRRRSGLSDEENGTV
jgi:hypothetical protein